MNNKEKIINMLKSLDDSMHRNECYACSHEFIDTVKEFGTCILAETIEYIESQPEVIRCKDCKHYNGLMEKCENDESYCKPNFYCGNAELKNI